MGSIKQRLYSVLIHLGTSSDRRRFRRGRERYLANYGGTDSVLTKEEKKLVSHLDWPSYAAFKVMSGIGGEHIRYYIPDSVYCTKYLPFLNPLNHTKLGWDIESYVTDKNYQDMLMGNLRCPKTIFHCIKGCFYDDSYERISKNQAEALLSDYDVTVFKQARRSCHGKGIQRVTKAEYTENILNFSDEYIVQECIHQHACLSYFNDSSVNVLRVTTLFWEGEIYVLGTILRIGAPGAFCDHLDYDGISCLNIAVYEDGTLDTSAFDITNFKRVSDVYGKKIPTVFPFYSEVVRAAIQGHLRIPHFGLIGWDFTVDTEGCPVCIEFNTRFPGITNTQFVLGPVFEKKSKNGISLLDEIDASMRRESQF